MRCGLDGRLRGVLINMLVPCALAGACPDIRAELSSEDYAGQAVIVPRAAPAPAPVPEDQSAPEPGPPAVKRKNLRPLSVRLTEHRCASCHSAAQYAQTGRTRLGWELAVLRMQLMNGAQVPLAERRTIVSHLAETHPAPTARALVEWLALGGTVAGTIALYVLTRRRGTAKP